MYGPNCIRGLSESVKPRRRYKERETIAECIWTFKFSNKCPHLLHLPVRTDCVCFCVLRICTKTHQRLFTCTGMPSYFNDFAHTHTGSDCLWLWSGRKIRWWFNGGIKCDKVVSEDVANMGWWSWWWWRGFVSRPQKCALYTFGYVHALAHAPTGTCYVWPLVLPPQTIFRQF